MKKKRIFSYCIILLLICQCLVGGSSVLAVTDIQKNGVRDHCEVIRDNLKDLQYSDSRTRVYLGRYYETILTKFIMPLNVRLVENNLSGTDLINNQKDFNQTRADFIASYVDYQKGLEDLVAIDCKTEPEVFYEKLEKVREKRKVVADETTRLRKLADKQVQLVQNLETKL